MTLMFPNTALRLRCVYKIEFPDGSFYIGSTCDFRVRALSYRSMFKRKSSGVNSMILNKVYMFQSAIISIVEEVPNGVCVKSIEDSHIKLNWDNPLNLNRSRSAYNNTGMVKIKR